MLGGPICYDYSNSAKTILSIHALPFHVLQFLGEQKYIYFSPLTSLLEFLNKRSPNQSVLGKTLRKFQSNRTES